MCVYIINIQSITRKKDTKNQDYTKGRKEPSGCDREIDNRDLRYFKKLV